MTAEPVTDEARPASPLLTRARVRLARLEGGWASYLVLGAPIITIAALAYLLRWTSDDGWINMRILMQLFDGNGFVFNAGERVEAGTSTLWLAILALGHLVAPRVDYGALAGGLGILLTTCAVWLATLAGIRVARRSTKDLAGFLPFGTVVVACLPPFWDFATSGLETSLNFCWMALCYWLLVRRLPEQGDPSPSAWRPLWPAVVIGLGWLVRPDAALYAAVFAVALLLQSRLGVLSWLGAFVAAVLIPGAYQIFRMGYFAALVPNTALAKDASSDRWSLGLYYLLDFAVPYALWVPVLFAVLVMIDPVRRWVRARDWRTLTTVLCPVLPAIAHALYVVRVGGDFMHARFLLPSTFALMLPVAVIGLRRGQQVWTALGALVLGWGMAVASGARVRYTGLIDTINDEWDGTPVMLGVANERAFWTAQALNHRTLSKRDWRGSPAATDGDEARGDQKLGRSYFWDPELWDWLQASASSAERDQLAQAVHHRDTSRFARRPQSGLYDTVNGHGVYLVAYNMGIKAVYAGTDVFLVDRLALTDAVTARAKASGPRSSRAGHQPTDPAWRAARYADLGDLTIRPVADAQAALQCGDVGTVIHATSDPMTWQRFRENLGLSFRLTFFTFPDDPVAARQVLCGPA